MTITSLLLRVWFRNVMFLCPPRSPYTLLWLAAACTSDTIFSVIPHHPFNPQVCQLCKPCQSESSSFLLKMAFLEHLNRRNFRRVYPHPISNMSTTDHHSLIHRHPKNITVANVLMSTWFEVKCRQDISWCN